MKIHGDFTGGNIKIIKCDGNDLYLENNIRDSSEDWFYWAFCIEDAQGKTLKFHFQPNRLGYWGPAVSYDLENWHWLNSGDENAFSYKFAENEKKVYFAHSMLYHPERFFNLAERLSLSPFTLCKSRKGRNVPAVKFGNGDKKIILAARHHSCESTGSYVLEGVLKNLTENPIENAEIFCVPFVDYDGVIDGDQGKSRIPHDHNRDYGKISAYPETAAIKLYAQKYGCTYGFDFHSPYHMGGVNDTVFLVRNSTEKLQRIMYFSECFEKTTTDQAMNYSSKNDFPPMTLWNKASDNFSYTMTGKRENNIALTLETTYFGTEDNKVSAERLVKTGECFAAAMKKYIESDFC